uniref:DUF3291 domain-containing protein n=1 Tax=Attheya septentrionalis TaxID=420275 RepID=A0A7S2XQQ6_9STRA|mmetsp:Transcript_27610/g.50122  ORF Transcript_27610/g.50122 Transcript_27610/m.50122 type:complete len:142 (+) Transcript_27610:178-603(+)
MKFYISITGLDLIAFYHAPKFWMHAIPSMTQARSSEGNISADGNTIQGTHHTLSVWKDRNSMLNYLRKGSHGKAMKIFDDIATGKVYGYESDTIPTWKEARELYDKHGRVIGKAARDAKRKQQEQKAEQNLDNKTSIEQSS